MDGRLHSAPPSGGTSLVVFVLAVATVLIAEGPWEKKASLIYPLLRARPAKTFPKKLEREG